METGKKEMLRFRIFFLSFQLGCRKLLRLSLLPKQFKKWITYETIIFLECPRELRLNNNVVPLRSKEEPIFPRREGPHDCLTFRSAQEKEAATIKACKRKSTTNLTES